MGDTVRRTGSSSSTPVPGGEVPGVPADPNTVIEGALDAYMPAEAGAEIGKVAATRVVGRNWGVGDPILRRHMTEVLIRALGLAMAQIDEPNAGAGQPPPSGTRIA